MYRSRVLVGGATALLLVLAAGQAALGGWVTAQPLNDPTERRSRTPSSAPRSTGASTPSTRTAAPPGRRSTAGTTNGYLTPKLVVRSGFVPNGNLCEAGNGDIHLVWEDWRARWRSAGRSRPTGARRSRGRR